MEDTVSNQNLECTRIYWNNPNKLVDRLRVLIFSKNTGGFCEHNNYNDNDEIQAILMTLTRLCPNYFFLKFFHHYVSI